MDKQEELKKRLEELQAAVPILNALISRCDLGNNVPIWKVRQVLSNEDCKVIMDTYVYRSYGKILLHIHVGKYDTYISSTQMPWIFNGHRINGRALKRYLIDNKGTLAQEISHLQDDLAHVVNKVQCIQALYDRANKIKSTMSSRATTLYQSEISCNWRCLL